MTSSSDSLDRSVIRSSAMPSLKYSCSGSPLRLLKASTAIDAFAAGKRVAEIFPAPLREAFLAIKRHERSVFAKRVSAFEHETYLDLI